ncbi:MAG: amidohydrolase [Chloroflexota bacterium]
MHQFADIVYKSGKIYTVEPEQSWATCVAILNGRFIFVGEDDEVTPLVGPNTQIVDLNQQMVMPGLHDMHIHGLLGAIGRLFECQFPMMATVDEIVTAVSRFATQNPHAPVIVGGSFHMSLTQQLNKAQLDLVCPARPVFLWDASLHNAWCNSKMLEMAGITYETSDPVNGTFVKDDNGQLTGLLLETAASAVYKCIPERAADEYAQAVDWLTKMLHSHGVTSIKEAAVNRAIAQAYKTADQTNKLKLRVGLHFLWRTPFIYDPEDLEPLLKDRQQFAGKRVKVNFLKLFLDGVPVAKTACMLDPYLGDDPETHDPYELLLVDREELKEILIQFDREGLIVKMHATGDASLRAALDAIEAARLANGDSGLGHEIAHPQNAHPNDLPRFAQLGAVPDLCPKLWHPSRGKDGALLPLVGKARLDKSWPIGSYHRSGARMIAGADWPAMSPTFNHWLGIQTLITRRDPEGHIQEPLGQNEAIDLPTALEIFTINGAKAARHDDVCGSIAVGKYADMIILDRNLFEIPADEIGETRVVKTIFEGEVVFDS